MPTILIEIILILALIILNGYFSLSSISIVLITEKTSDNIIGIISFHDIFEEIVGEFKSG